MRRYRAASSVVAVRRRHRSTKDVLYLDGSIATAIYRGGKDVKSRTCWLLLATDLTRSIRHHVTCTTDTAPADITSTLLQ